LFAEWVLVGADAQLLPARERARSNATSLQQRAAPVGLTPPAEIEEALRAWDFDRAERLVGAARAALDLHVDSLNRAQSAGYSLGDGFARSLARSADEAMSVARQEAAALDAVQRAQDRLDEPRSLLMRIGLVARDLSREAESARSALAEGDYDAAIDRATAMEERLDNARREGAVRLGIAAAVGLVLIGITVARLTRRRKQRPWLASRG
jgi:hypothetical protein